MSDIADVRTELTSHGNPAKAATYRNFFKNADKDIFLGIPIPQIRSIARQFLDIRLDDLTVLCRSNVQDERMLGMIIATLKFKKASDSDKEHIFNWYLTQRHCMRDWAMVDCSAPYIVGAWLENRSKDILFELVRSDQLYVRRIAIVATWHFIRNNQSDTTLALAEILLTDKEDLIHKATGWMLREVGKRISEQQLTSFLDLHHRVMPRTMLRYALEKLSPEQRAHYMKK